MPKIETSLMDAETMNAALLDELRRQVKELRGHLHCCLQHSAPAAVQVPESLPSTVMADMLFCQLDGYMEELARSRADAEELRAKLAEAESASATTREALEAAADARRERDEARAAVTALQAELAVCRSLNR